MFEGILNLFHNFIFLFLKVSDNETYPPPLSAKEEKECFIRMKNGDMIAREKLIRHNMRLVAHIVKKYYTLSKNQDDLISIGTIGLIKAIDNFDPNNGARFATYAGKCLQNEILMHFRSRKKLQNEVSVNDILDTDKDGNPLTYIDIISVPDTVADDIDKKMKTEKVYYAIKNVLSKRERQVIVMRYGLNGKAPMRQRCVAQALGISRSYVSRIEKASLEKIKKTLNDSGFYS
ncbi:MAG: RNA polymerase sporulation sigma factor SigK [Clostridia bacterium]|nr:RNA polymerase sporulation sigma factor SigK [Clostridia bacterium]